MHTQPRIVWFLVKLVVIVVFTATDYLFIGYMFYRQVTTGINPMVAGEFFQEWPELAVVTLVLSALGPIAFTALLVQWLQKFIYFRKLQALVSAITSRTQEYEIETPQGTLTVRQWKQGYKLNFARKIPYGVRLDVYYLDGRHFWAHGYPPRNWLIDGVAGWWLNQHGNMRSVLKALRGTTIAA